MDSAAALSDSVIAAAIVSVTRGGLPPRYAASINGTLIVDHAGPLRRSPHTVGSRSLPTALTANPYFVFVSYFAVAVAIAEVSFRYYETPFLRLRYRPAPKAAS